LVRLYAVILIRKDDSKVFSFILECEAFKAEDSKYSIKRGGDTRNARHHDTASYIAYLS